MHFILYIWYIFYISYFIYLISKITFSKLFKITKHLHKLIKFLFKVKPSFLTVYTLIISLCSAIDTNQLTVLDQIPTSPLSAIGLGSFDACLNNVCVCLIMFTQLWRVHDSKGHHLAAVPIWIWIRIWVEKSKFKYTSSEALLRLSVDCKNETFIRGFCHLANR